MEKWHSKSRFEDSMSNPANQRRNPIEETFYAKENDRLVENLKTMRQMQETKEALQQVSGITDEKILEKLVEINLRPETLASLMMLPLVEVAWAYGALDDEVKKAILLAATNSGISQGSVDYELLKHWFVNKPVPELLDAWIYHIHAVCKSLSVDERKKLKEQMLTHAVDIAESSGGILGLINRISNAEKAMIAKLEEAFTSAVA